VHTNTFYQTSKRLTLQSLGKTKSFSNILFTFFP
jgi:hypothetical protein